MLKDYIPQMDVLHVTEACGGGVRRHLKLIVPELVNRGFRCGVCGFGHRVEEDFLYDLQAYQKIDCMTELWPFNHGNLLGCLGYLRHFRRLIRQWKPAVIHAHSSMAGFVCRLAKNALPGVRIVYSPHAFALHPSLPFLVRNSISCIENRQAHLTDAYAFVGRSEIQDANRLGLPPEQFHLIENGLPADFTKTLYTREDARRALGIPADALMAVIPCRLSRQKGLDQVIRAISLMDEKCSRLKFMFCGDGPEKENLQAMARKMNVENRILFQGAVEHLAVLLPAFDLAILPSLYEGLSYVLLECLAAGIPLVVSDILANVPRPELRDILHVFPVGDSGKLADTLSSCLLEQERTSIRAQLGIEFMFNNFQLDNQIQKLSNLYKMLM